MGKRIAIIGAGPAGCFCALNLKRSVRELDVVIFEASDKALHKLSLTGGGRCNISNTFEGVTDLGQVYPRGARLLSQLFKVFGPEQTRDWFASEGIPFLEEDGGRLFPRSRDAMQVVRFLLGACRDEGVRILCKHKVVSIEAMDDGRYSLEFASEGNAEATDVFDAVVVSSGGDSGIGTQSYLDSLNVARTAPVPSLFTLRIPDTALNSLSGLTVPDAILSIPGQGFKACGPVLITDWGLSGPAALRLSSHAARFLWENAYDSPLSINWTGLNEQAVRQALMASRTEHAGKLCANADPFPELPARLWRHLLAKSGMREDMRWGETGSKGINRLCATLIADTCRIKGKARFKEEFVTCGGVSLDALVRSRLESRDHPGLFFAGEALDVDGITGGFNLQAAWTTGFICARNLALLFK